MLDTSTPQTSHGHGAMDGNIATEPSRATTTTTTDVACDRPESLPGQEQAVAAIAPDVSSLDQLAWEIQALKKIVHAEASRAAERTQRLRRRLTWTTGIAAAIAVFLASALASVFFTLQGRIAAWQNQQDQLTEQVGVLENNTVSLAQLKQQQQQLDALQQQTDAIAQQTEAIAGTVTPLPVEQLETLERQLQALERDLQREAATTELQQQFRELNATLRQLLEAQNAPEAATGPTLESTPSPEPVAPVSR